MNNLLGCDFPAWNVQKIQRVNQSTDPHKRKEVKSFSLHITAKSIHLYTS